MNRGVVHNRAAPRVAHAPALERAQDQPDADTTEEDPYGSKLLKYIPAEVLGGYLPIVLAVDAQRGESSGDKVDDLYIWIVFLLGVLATVGYLAYRVRDETVKPRWFFYALAALIGFPAWAFVSSEPLRDVSGISEGWAQVFVAVVIFVIPVVDWAVGELDRRFVQGKLRK